jgi:biotin carboxyl carrier protein
MDKDTLNAIMYALDGTSVAECEIAAKGGVIRIVRNPRHARAPLSIPKSISEPDSEIQSAGENDTVDIVSLWVGHFYRGTAKGAKPCVKLRDLVKEGQQVGCVDIMNVFQNVTSPIAGKLVEFLVEDGQAVEYGQPLARIKIDEQDAS